MGAPYVSTCQVCLATDVEVVYTQRRGWVCTTCATTPTPARPKTYSRRLTSVDGTTIAVRWTDGEPQVEIRLGTAACLCSVSDAGVLSGALDAFVRRAPAVG